MKQLEEIKARHDRACTELDRLAASNPGSAWRWSIPANPERDSDLILADSLAAIPKLIAALEVMLELANGSKDDGYHVTDLYVHKNKIRAAITEALA